MVGSNPHSLVVALAGSAIGVLAMLIVFYENRRDGNKPRRRHHHRHHR
jgi:hypothetical protein